MKIKTIKQVECRMFYDSTWEVEFEDGTTCKIIRDDLETEENLKNLLEDCQTIEEVKEKVDLWLKIYYD